MYVGLHLVDLEVLYINEIYKQAISRTRLRLVAAPSKHLLEINSYEYHVVLKIT